MRTLIVENLNTLILNLLIDFKWYRQRKKGTYYFVRWTLDPGMRYWTTREPLRNELIIKTEKY